MCLGDADVDGENGLILTSNSQVALDNASGLH
jgi:hypothetical protein